MNKLYKLAREFRHAIDQAKSRREFNTYSCLFTFPDGCCDMTCDLLGEYFCEHGIHTFQINAQSKYDCQWRHVWLKTFDGIVIDITGDQFIGKSGFPKVIDNVYVGKENEVHRIFCLDRKKEENTTFTDPLSYNGFDGEPNFRQRRLIDAYKIIKEYLRETN